MVFVCKFCDLDYNIRRDWKRHILKVHGIQSYGCDVCPEAFYEEKDLLEHVAASHDGQLRHACPHCSMSYKRDKDLDVHIHYKHKIDKMIACEKCGQEFHNNIAYKKHLQLQHKPGHVYHKCKNCVRSFRFKHHLKLHEEFDHEKNGKQLLLKYIKKLNLEKGVLADVSQCRLCKIKFNCSLDLIQHLKLNHAKKKTFACCQCKEAVYYSRASLGIHMRHEHGILSHSCSKCPAPQRPSRTAPIKPKNVKVKKRVPALEQRNLFEKSVLRQLTNKPSQKINTAKSKAPWANRFINENLPSDLDLNDVSEEQLNNLSHNIKTVFNILSTVAPSRLKASQTAPLSKKPGIIGRNMNIVSFMFPQNHPGSRTPTFLSKKSDNLMEVVIQQVGTEQVISKHLDSDAGKRKGVNSLQIKTNSSIEMNQTLGLLEQNSLLLQPSQHTPTHDAENIDNKLKKHVSNSEQINELKETSKSTLANISEFKVPQQPNKQHKSTMKLNETHSLNHKKSEVHHIKKTGDEVPIKINDKNAGKLAALNNLDAKTNLDAISRTKSPCKSVVEGSNLDRCDASIKGFKQISDRESNKVESSKKFNHSMGLYNKSESTNNKPVKDPNVNRIKDRDDPTFNITDKITESLINLNDQNSLNVTLEFPSDIDVGKSNLTEASGTNISASNNNISHQLNISKSREDNFQSSKSCNSNITVGCRSSESSIKKGHLLKQFESISSQINVTDGKIQRNQFKSMTSNHKKSSIELVQNQETLQEQEKVFIDRNIKAKEMIESPEKSSPEPNMDILFSLQLTKKKPVHTNIIPKIKVRDFSKDMPAFNAVSPTNNALPSMLSKDHNVSFDECDDSSDTIAQIEAFLANDDAGKTGSREKDDTSATPIPSGPAKTSLMINENQRSSRNKSKMENPAESTVASVQSVLEQLISTKPDNQLMSNSVNITRVDYMENAASSVYVSRIDTAVEKTHDTHMITKPVKEKMIKNTVRQKSNENDQKSTKLAHKDKGKEKSPSTKTSSLQKISTDEIRVNDAIEESIPMKASKSSWEKESTSANNKEVTSLKEVHKAAKKSKHRNKKSEDDDKKCYKKKSKSDGMQIKTILGDGSQIPHLNAMDKFLVKKSADFTDNNGSIISKSIKDKSSSQDEKKTSYLKSSPIVKDTITGKNKVTGSATLNICDDGDKKPIQSNQDAICPIKQYDRNSKGRHHKLEDNNHAPVQDIKLSVLNALSCKEKYDKAGQCNAQTADMKSSSKSNKGDGQKHSQNKEHKKNKSPQLKTISLNKPSHEGSSSVRCTDKDKKDKNNESAKHSNKTSKDHVAEIKKRKCEPEYLKTHTPPKKGKDESNLISKTSLDLPSSNENGSVVLSSVILSDNVNETNKVEKEVQKKESLPTVQDLIPVQKNDSICSVTTSHSDLKETQPTNNKKSDNSPENKLKICEANIKIMRNKFEPENEQTISLPKKRKHEQDETKIISKISLNLTPSNENSLIAQSPVKFLDNDNERNEENKEVKKKKTLSHKKSPKKSKTNSSEHTKQIPPTLQEDLAPVQRNDSACNFMTAHSNLIETQISNDDKTFESSHKNLNIVGSNNINVNKSPSFQDVFIQEIRSINDTEEGSSAEKSHIQQVKPTCSIKVKPDINLQTSHQTQKSCTVSDSNQKSDYPSDKESERQHFRNTIEKVTSCDNNNPMILNQHSPEPNVDNTSSFSNQKTFLGAPLKRVIILPKTKTVKSADKDYNMTLKGCEIKTNKEDVLAAQKTHLGQDQLSSLHLKKAIVITKDMIIRPNLVGTSSMKEKLSFKKMYSNGSSQTKVQQNKLDHTVNAKASYGHKFPHDITQNMISPLDLVNILNGNQQNNDSVKETVKIVNPVPLKENEKVNQAKESVGSDKLLPEVKHTQFLSGNKSFSEHKMVLQPIDTKNENKLDNENKINITFSVPNCKSNEKNNNIGIDSTLPEEKVYKNDAEGLPEYEVPLSTYNFGMPDYSPANKNEFLETESNDSMDVANYVDIVTCSSPNVSSEIPNKSVSHENTDNVSAREYSCQFCSLNCYDEIVLLNHLTETHAYDNEKNYETDFDKTLYKCGTCGAGFSLKDSLEIHTKEQHDENFKMYVQSESGKWQKGTCDTCGEDFVTQMEFDSHGCPPEVELKVEVESTSKKRVRSPDIVKRPKYQKQKIKVYKCDTCNVKFKSGLLLYNHNRKRHTDPIYKCDACSCQFRNKRDYLRHRCAPAPIACKKCKITFISKDLLLEHKKERHNMGSLKCEYCSKYFKTNRNLMKHTTLKHFKTSEYKNLVHKPSKQAKKCNSQKNDIYNDLKIINQATVDSNLITDMETSGAKAEKKKSSPINMKHVTNPGHTCDICELEFQSDKELRLHSKIHRSLRRLYKCLKCPKKFSLKTALLNHIKKDHKLEPNKIHRCQYCCAVFKFEDKLKQHYKFKHSNPGEDTPIIGAQTSNNTAQMETLIISKETSTRKDKIRTSASFITPKLMKGEMFRCDECSAYLPSKESLHRHIQLEHQKVHSCTHCSQVFTTTESFWQHLIKGHGNVKIQELLPRKESQPAENTIKWKTQLVHNYKRQGE